jgi:branched-chain amino acid transport system substrate-binding protein
MRLHRHCRIIPAFLKKIDREINMVQKTAIAFSFLAFISGIMLSSALAASSIKIGILLPLTGRQASFGQVQRKSVLMAADEINAGGGVNGEKIELIIADTQGNPDAGRAAIEKLITRDRVLIIGGGISSSVTWAAISIAQQKKTAFLVTSAAADKITEQNWDFIFRLNQPASEHLETMASFIKKVATDIKSVAIVHANSLQSSADARKFFKKAEALDLNIVSRESFETGADDFRPLLIRVKSRNPDLLYGVTDDVNDAAHLTRLSKELNLSPKLFVGGTLGFALYEFEKNAGSAANYVVYSTQWTTSVPYPGAKEYNTKFMDTYHTAPTVYGAQAYAAIYVMADALKRTQALTPEKARDALAKTNMMTPLGPVKFISYNQKSQQNRLPTFLAQWLDGQAEIIWPQSMATHKAVYPIPQ